MPQLAETIQPAEPRDALTQDQRDRLEKQIDFALYLLCRPAGAPEWDRLSTSQRGMVRTARRIALASIDPAKLQEGAF